MTTVRLILGDQLNRSHHWFAVIDPDVVFVMMEIRQETDYVLHHAQKVIAIFAAMRALSSELVAAGHRVHYLRISDPQNRQELCANLSALMARLQAVRFEWQAPDEYRLDLMLSQFAQSLAIQHAMVDTEHFLTGRGEVQQFFKRSTSWLLETFYRHMRREHGVLLDEQRKPLGGRWNFDGENRGVWRGTPQAPADVRIVHDHRALWQEIEAAQVKTFGSAHADAVRWPVNRLEALDQLSHFINDTLPFFGLFQDAMNSGETYLFHSLLSFALNVKMLSPAEVIKASEDAYLAGHAPLEAVEGFIRQILGWREYMRGVYWARMPGYTDLNHLKANRALPKWYWDGQTQMACLRHSVSASLEHAYAHHIQRLMVTGNFALLAGVEPQQVHRWYLGIYIDAFEWVEAPNTLGMSQYADGGALSSKPYVSSAAYIHRMSNYCGSCRYNQKDRLGENACPFNALYWDFFDRHEHVLEGNHRLAMVYKNLRRMPAEERAAIRVKASALLDRIDDL